jgi:hypothetical protein
MRVVVLHGEALATVQRAWAARQPNCDHLFHIDGNPLGRNALAKMTSYLDAQRETGAPPPEKLSTASRS